NVVRRARELVRWIFAPRRKFRTTAQGLRNVHARSADNSAGDRKLGELVLERAAVHAEHARGARDVPVALLQHALDVLALDLRERRYRVVGLAAGSVGIGFEGGEDLVRVGRLRQVVARALAD